jgi:NAD(P)-dependent dehydrogenase (short-subunit alcohol dehydrogenase family)
MASAVDSDGVVIVAGATSRAGLPGSAGLAAAKYLVMGRPRHFAAHRRDGLRVNAIWPGMAGTGRHQRSESELSKR